MLRSVDLVRIARFCCELKCYVRITVKKKIGVLSLEDLSFFTSIGLSLLQFLFYTSKLDKIDPDIQLVKNIEKI